jgi:3-oxoacyl-[acyl-carrier protein] reductase
MKLNLDNKKVLVTGSSKGIGLNIAKEFIKENAYVCINSRDNKNLINAKNSIKSKKLFCLKYNLTNEKNHSKILNQANKLMKGIDILICNLGDGRKLKTTGEETYKDWITSLKINLLSATNLIFKSKKYLKKSKTPSIVCVSSICGLVSSAAPLDYSASKSALNMYVRNQSHLLAEHNIRINLISPGNIYSRDGRWPSKIKKNKELEFNIIKNVPLKRFGTTAEIADAVLFLSSEISSFTTGANLVIDGGQSA